MSGIKIIIKENRVQLTIVRVCRNPFVREKCEILEEKEGNYKQTKDRLLNNRLTRHSY